MLLFGPNHNGKTLLAKSIAFESQRYFIYVDPTQITGSFIGDCQKYIKSLFAVATNMHPCVIFFKKAELIFFKRSNNQKSNDRSLMINEFIKQMDLLNNLDINIRPLIIVSTTKPWELDDAVLRRLEFKSFLPLPEKESIILLMIRLMDNANLKYIMSQIHFDRLADTLKG